jgi:hypothetical protein
MGGRLRQINTAAKYLYWSILKKSRHLEFGVFIYIWSKSIEYMFPKIVKVM